MPRYIDADALKHELINNIDEQHKAHFAMVDTDFIALIDDAPTADVREVKHGHWITRNEGNPFLIYGECSVCEFGQSLSAYLNFCPNCGAKMD